MEPRPRARPALVAFATGAAFFLGALAVRGIPGPKPVQPEDAPGARPSLPEPMQFLSRGAVLRMRELSRRVDPARADDWANAWRLPYDLTGCPSLLEWIEGPDGSRVERLLGELRRGSRDEALAALSLVVQIARATDWAPGLMARTQHAERLGGLLQDWLRVWAPRSADDPQLLEPALAATLLYGRVMRTAYDAPTIGTQKAPYERARLALDEWTGAHASARTPFGERLAQRYPHAFATIAEKNDFLIGCTEEARVLFPEIDGSCGE